MLESRHQLRGTRRLASTLLAGVALLAATPWAAAADAWTDLGGALSGVNGDPLLLGTGTLQAATPGSLSLLNAAPSNPAILFVSLGSTPVPFKGGTLQAFPFLLSPTLTTSPFGGISFGFVTPTGLPAGLEIVVQYAIKDTTAINGVSISNAIRGLVPAAGPVIEDFSPVAGIPGTPLTLTGSGFSADPADATVVVGGLVATPITGTTAEWTGILPTFPAADIGPEPIVILMGDGQAINPSGGGFAGGFSLPPIQGIKSNGNGQIWNGNNHLDVFTTSSLFDKVAGPPDISLAINAYLPNGLVIDPATGNITKIILPLGNTPWNPSTTYVDFNMFIVEADGTAYSLTLNEITFVNTVPPPSVAVCGSTLANLLTTVINAAGWPAFAALQFNPVTFQFEIVITPTGSFPVKQVCGGWTIHL